MNNRHQIVRGEMAVYELLRRTLHPRCAERCCMQIIENEHIYPAGKWALVASNIGLYGSAGDLARCLRRNLDKCEAGNRLRFAVLENLEILFPKVSHDRTTLVGHEGIDLYIFEFRLERRELARRCVGGLRCQRHGQECPEGDGGDETEETRMLSPIIVRNCTSRPSGEYAAG